MPGPLKLAAARPAPALVAGRVVSRAARTAASATSDLASSGLRDGAGQLVRQPEAREALGRDERGDLRDRLAVEAEDVERDRAVRPGLAVELVVRERGLRVRRDRDSDRDGAELRGALDEAGDRLAAAPPARPRRHREDR